MEMQAFYKKAARLLEKMNLAETKYVLHNLARQTQEFARSQFLHLLEESLGQADRTANEYKQIIPDKQIKQLMADLERDFAALQDGTMKLACECHEEYGRGTMNDWVSSYSDPDGVIDFIEEAIALAQDCLFDCRYQEAKRIYELLFQSVITAEDEDGGDLETFTLDELHYTDLIVLDEKKLTLQALYAIYQSHDLEQRPAALFACFDSPIFSGNKLEIKDVFLAGREEIKDQADFIPAWLAYLQTQNGAEAERLLAEASQLAAKL